MQLVQNIIARSLPLAVFLVLGIVSAWASAVQPPHFYRPFYQAPSPEYLNQLLGDGDAVQKKIVADRIADMIQEKIGNLGPEQRAKLTELAKQFSRSDASGRFFRDRRRLEEAIEQDPELKNAIEELQTELRRKNFDEQATESIREDLSRELQNRLQREIERQSRILRQNSGSGIPTNPFENNRTDGNPSPDIPPRNRSEPIDPFDPNGFGSNRTPSRNGNPKGDPDANSKSSRNPSVDPSTNNDSLRSEPGSGSSSNPSEIPENGFRDDGRDFQQPRPESPPASASGQNETPPRDSISHRFNRILMNSVENAMGRRLGEDVNEGPGHVERLLDKYISAVVNDRSGSGTPGSGSSRGILDRMMSGLNGLRTRGQFSIGRMNRSTPDIPNVLPMAGQFSGESIRTLLMFLMVVGMIVAAVVWALKSSPVRQMLGLANERDGETGPPDLTVPIADQGDVIKLIDQFALWHFGRKASWWHSRLVQQNVAELVPESAGDFAKVMEIYDLARYAPARQLVSTERVLEIRQVLQRIEENIAKRQQAQASVAQVQSYPA